MNGIVRPISWVRAARKSYAKFPQSVQDQMNVALAIAAAGGKADIAKPLKSFGSGVMEVAVRHRGNAWRVVYLAELGGSLWVVHAFQKKSKRGIATPQTDLDLIRHRLGRLRKELDL